MSTKTNLTPISDTQKGRLEKIVIENNTYDRYYAAKHGKADSGLVAKNKAGIAAYNKLSKEVDAINLARTNDRNKVNEKHRAEREERNSGQEKEMNEVRTRHSKEDKAMEARQDKELDAIQETSNAKTTILSEKMEKVESGLKSVGLRSQYIHHNEYKWIPDDNRFQNEYQNWLRDLRARIITATSAEEAKALVDEFLLK